MKKSGRSPRSFPRKNQAPKAASAASAVKSLGVQAAVRVADGAAQLEQTARALDDAGQTEQALASWSALLQQQPGNLVALLRQAAALDKLGRNQQAADAYQQLIAVRPGIAELYNNLGALDIKLGRVDAALSHFERAYQLGSREPVLLKNYGLALLHKQRSEAAQQVLAPYVAAYPDDVSVRSALVLTALKLADWSTPAEVWRDLLQRSSQPLELQSTASAMADDPPVPFPMLCLPIDVTEQQLQVIARKFAGWVERRCTPQRFADVGPGLEAEARLALLRQRIADRQAASGALNPARIKLGYLSSDMHNHATAHLMLGMFGLHDRQRFEVFVYSYGPDDGSHYRRRIANDADHFIDLETLDAAAAADRIHADGIDILIDLKGYTRDSRPEILAQRPAPVQIQWLGYPGTMGARWIDYTIGDPVVTPPEVQPWFDEQILRMPASYQVNDDQQPLAAAPSRAACGLPEAAWVWCCFCTLHKIEPRVWGAWMRLLQASPGSVLWLIDGPAIAKQRLRDAAQAAGIDPQRLVFAPHLPKDQHLARHCHADLFLDTLYYNAHTTASDALWAGVPVISLPGQTFAQKVGASLLKAVGLPELIASSLADYEAKALALYADRQAAAALKSKLQALRTECALFDTRGFVAAFEGLLLGLADGGRVQEPEVLPDADIAPDAEPLPGASQSSVTEADVMRAWQQGDAATALDLAQQMAALQPQRADLQAFCGVALRKLGRLPEALAAHQRALTLRPDDPEASNNLGNVYLDLGDLEQAQHWYQRALTLRPDYQKAWINLGGAQQSMGDLPAARASFDRVAQLYPGDPEVRWNRALCCLMQGDWRAGLDDYEARWQRGEPPAREFVQPGWAGEPLARRRLLIHAEQGYGDAIQYLRFVPQILTAMAKQPPQTGPWIVLELLKELHPLIPPDARVQLVERGAFSDQELARRTGFDVHAPLLSLPQRLGVVDDAGVAMAGAYLQVPADKQTAWRKALNQRLGQAPGKLRVGLVWSGNPKVRNDAERSPGAALLAPMLALARQQPDLQLVLLQCGAGRQALASLLSIDAPLPANVLDLGDQLHDFADTAAVMQAMDWVVSSDTSTAHLAGALGVDGLIVLPKVPDWRWRLDGVFGPWYPSLRLLRQQQRGVWQAPVQQAVDRVLSTLTTAQALAPTLPLAALQHVQQQLLDQGATAAAWAMSLVAQQPLPAGWANDLGTLAVQEGRLDDGLAALQAAVQLAPDWPVARFNLGLARLQTDDYPAGFADYIHRHRLPQITPHPWPAPLWDGSALAGKQFLLYAEQGFGDTLQMLRFVPALLAMGARPVLQVQPPLRALVEHSFADVTVVSDGDVYPAVDVKLSLLDLPFRLGLRCQDLPVTQAYLQADPLLRQRWRDWLISAEHAQLGASATQAPRKRIGIVWAGSPTSAVEAQRGYQLSRLLPLMQQPGLTWVVLQMGAGRTQMQPLWSASDRDDAPLRLPANVLDPGDALHSFADTAALMAELDLVVTSDTAPAHLAGALGVPGVVLLHDSADWRWTQHQQRSRWYPSLLLLRQASGGHWAPVLDALASYLRDGSAAEPAVARPDPMPLLVQAHQLYQGQLPAWMLTLDDTKRAAARFQRGVALCDEALALDPMLPAAWVLKAMLLRCLGHAQADAQAEDCYRRVLRLHPGCVDAWSNLVNLLQQQRRWADALEAQIQLSQRRRLPYQPQAIATPVASDPAQSARSLPTSLLWADLHRLADLFRCAGRPALALAVGASAVQAAAIDGGPTYAQALLHLGNTWFDVAAFDRAQLAYRRALRTAELDSELYQEALFNLATTQQRCGALAEAVRSYRKLLGEVGAGQPDQAAIEPLVPQWQVITTPGQITPQRWQQGVYNLALALQTQANPPALAQAQQCYLALLARHPNHAGAQLNLAAMLNQAGDYPAALAAYDAVLGTGADSDRPSMLPARLERMHLWQKQVAWAQPDAQPFERELAALATELQAFADAATHQGEGQAAAGHTQTSAATVCSPFAALNLHAPISEAVLQQVARAYAQWEERRCEPGRFADVLPNAPLSERQTLVQNRLRARRAMASEPSAVGNAPVQSPRLKLGYLSSDLHNHATAHLIQGMLGQHDRTRFEIFVYSYGPDDGSSYRQQIRSRVEHFVDLYQASSRSAADRIHADQIDVLIDLKGYTRLSRPDILAQRPAPIQIQWLGYPGSMGARWIDYTIGDAWVTPEPAQAWYDEQILRMPNSYQANDDQQPIAAIPARAACGLPEQAWVWCCFCAHHKIDASIWGAWMQILQRSPGSVLWLIDGPPVVQQRLRGAARAAGINPDRLVFAPHQPKAEHLARHQHADLFLDTRYYNAHTTASDALWAGVPVLSVQGDSFASRVGASLLQAIGMPELIVDTLDAYIAKALFYWTNRQAHAQLRARLASHRQTQPLFQTTAFVRAFEQRVEQGAGHRMMQVIEQPAATQAPA